MESYTLAQLHTIERREGELERAREGSIRICWFNSIDIIYLNKQKCVIKMGYEFSKMSNLTGYSLVHKQRIC